jgi:hypothetical protein
LLPSRATGPRTSPSRTPPSWPRLVFYFDSELPSTTCCFFSFTAYVMSEPYIVFLPFSFG